MAANPSVKKRQKEMARLERQRDKAAKREQRKADRQSRDSGNPGEDPDLAGIVPGPQPVLEEG